jgi:hypothetical protein
MSKPNPAGGQANAPKASGEQEPQPPTVTGVVSEQSGEAGDVPAGTEPLQAAPGVLVEPADESVEVVLAHHWTDPQSGRTYGPRQTAWVSADMANTLRGAKYLLNPQDTAALRAEQDAESAGRRGGAEDRPGGNGENGGDSAGRQA